MIDDSLKQTTHHPSAVERFESFKEMASGKLLTVFLDYDGTISEIVNQPERAFMTSEMRDAVRRVASLYPTAIISGRSREKVYDFVRLPELYYAGSHGLDIVAPANVKNASEAPNEGGEGEKSAPQRELHQPAPWAPAVMDDVFRRATAAIASIPGATVDHNKFCVSVHYRNCENREDWTRVKSAVDAIVASDPERLKHAEGRKVFEVKPRVAWDKGKALSYLLGQLGLENDPANAKPGSVLSLYFGDDHTDEDAFDELKQFPDGAGCGVIVSSVPKPSCASFSVKNPSEVLTFLNSIADLAEQGVTRSLNTAATIKAET
jgi:trehalose 6-phosphate phosphatase